jgi:pilus assembly protein CpaB
MNRRIVLIGVAVVLALFGTFAVYGYAHSADQRAVAGGHAVQVVVATKRVAAGTSWKSAVRSLSVQNVPASSAPEDSITSLSADISASSVAQSDIAPGQLVLREAFAPAVAQTGVLAIPQGMIAISLSLASDADVAGFIGPRSQVAVFATAPMKTARYANQDMIGATLTVTRTVVPHAEVIATSQSAPTNVDGQSASQSSTSTGTVLVTVALTQADAERVINMQKVGELTLGLLSASSKVTQDGGYVNASTFRTAQVWVK